MNGLVPQDMNFSFSITYTAVYCTSDLNVSNIDDNYIFRVGEYSDKTYLLIAETNDCFYTITSASDPITSDIEFIQSAFYNPDPERINIWD